ncbi:hypothetical protein A4G18_08840 [Pasteurellaceae bacterium Pebbles2]|nr:hypothetical protein [Pasteurellaceae bacterium Pebbles2]
MLKKIGTGLLFVILAFFAFIYVQKGKIEENITALLKENAEHLQVKQVALHFFPTPAVELQDFAYNVVENQLNQGQFRANFILAKLNLLPLLTGNVEFNGVEVVQGSLYYKAKDLAPNGQKHAQNTPHFQHIQLNLSLKSSFSLHSLGDALAKFSTSPKAEKLSLPEMSLSLSVQNAQNDQFDLQGVFHFVDSPTSSSASLLRQLNFSQLQSQILLKNQPLFNTHKINLSAQNGRLSWVGNDRYQLELENISFNQLALNSMTLQVQESPVLSATMQARQSDNAGISLSLRQQKESYMAGYHWEIQGEQLSLADWLAAFNVPQMVSGKTNVKVRLFSQDFLPRVGDFSFNIKDGKVSGINLLQLISQYAPINVDPASVNEKAIETSFDVAQAQFQWQPDLLKVTQAKMLHQYFVMEGQGVADLTQGTCDFRSQIALNNPNYRALALPVHFFGDCQSPEYKLEINRDFRQQLKDFIKEKLR